MIMRSSTTFITDGWT